MHIQSNSTMTIITCKQIVFLRSEFILEEKRFLHSCHIVLTHWHDKIYEFLIQTGKYLLHILDANIKVCVNFFLNDWPIKNQQVFSYFFIHVCKYFGNFYSFLCSTGMYMLIKSKLKGSIISGISEVIFPTTGMLLLLFHKMPHFILQPKSWESNCGLSQISAIKPLQLGHKESLHTGPFLFRTSLLSKER